MTQERKSGDSDAAEVPHAAFLNYLANKITPTRVRMIAARALWVTGITYLLIACLMMGIIVLIIPGAVAIRYGPMPVFSIPPLALVQVVLEDMLPQVLVLGYALLLGTMQVLLTGPVRRGNSRASRMAWASIIPLAILLLLGTFGFGVAGTLAGLGMDDPARPAYLLLFFPALLGVILFLLLKDLGAYLRWIGNHPGIEKPPVAFLPGKERGR